MDIRDKITEILHKDQGNAIRELDRLFFVDCGYLYWDKTLSQNRVFLANCISLLFYMKKHCPDIEDPMTFEMLQRVACDVTSCREIIHQLEMHVSRGRSSGKDQVSELLSWFNASCVNGRSSFYENTEYLRMILRYPELGDFDL